MKLNMSSYTLRYKTENRRRNFRDEDGAVVIQLAKI